MMDSDFGEFLLGLEAADIGVDVEVDVIHREGCHVRESEPR
jgi:hypothetical protein